jgi:hypothetical protein
MYGLTGIRSYHPSGKSVRPLVTPCWQSGNISIGAEIILDDEDHFDNH